MMIVKSSLSAALVSGSLLLSSSLIPANGALNITAVEDDENVLFMMYGTLDLGAWTFWDKFYASSTYLQAGVGSDGLQIGGDRSPKRRCDLYLDPAYCGGPISLASGDAFTQTTRSSGDFIGLWWDVNDYYRHALLVPHGYESGEELWGTATFAGHTFASLGLTPGTHRWSWSDAAGDHADSITMHVVPEPSTFASVGIGVAALLVLRRRG